MPKKIGPVLRRLREGKALTQEDVAIRAKVARSYLAMLEAGNRGNPSLEILQRLAKALGVTVQDLL